MESIEAQKHPEGLRRLPQLLCERVGLDVDVARFRRRHTLHRHQELSQHEQQRQFVPEPLGAVRQRREQCAPFGESRNGFVRRIPPGGIVPRLLPIVNGPSRLAPALEVHGELGGYLPRLGPIAVLQPQADAPVQVHPSRRPQLLVQHPWVEGMLKLVAPRPGRIRPLRHPAVIDEVVLCHQPFTLHLDLMRRALQTSRHRGRGKGLPDHTGDLQHLPRLQREGLDAAHEELL